MTAPDGLRDRLTAAWQLFGLAVRTERLVLRLPTDGELLELMDVVKAGIHPPEVMPFATPWSVMPSPAFERNYLSYHWANRASWAADAWELGLAVWLDDVPIGMQGIHARGFATHRKVDTGSWIGQAFQGQGYGTEMRTAVLTLAFDGLGAVLAETEAFLDNAASNGVSRSLGYDENGVGSLAPLGTARETRRFRMTVDGWRSRPRPPVAIEGLEACRDLFGLERQEDRDA